MVSDKKKIAERKGRTFKSILIEPFKQMKFGIYVLALSLAFVSATAGLFIYAFNEQYQQVMSIFGVVDPDLRWELVTNDVFLKNAYMVIGLLAAYMAALFTVVFKLTHRYYGPLVSVERLIDNLSIGRYNSRIQVRSDDELQRLVSKLNMMAENLQKKHGHLVNEEGNPVERRSRDEEQQEEGPQSLDNAS